MADLCSLRYGQRDAMSDENGAVERMRNWLDRGNPTGGMNLPIHDGKTPSIRDDLRTVVDLIAHLTARAEEEENERLQRELRDALRRAAPIGGTVPADRREAAK